MTEAKPKVSKKDQKATVDRLHKAYDDAYKKKNKSTNKLSEVPSVHNHN